MSTLGGVIPNETARIVGLLYINTLVRRARERDPLDQTNKQHTIYVDECHSFVSRDLAEILDELRKYSLSLVMACQTMEQIRLADERVYASVKSVARTKIAFAEESYEEALRLAKDLYASDINPDRPKTVLNKPVVTGHRTIRLRNRSSSSSESLTQTLGAGVFQSDSFGTTHSEGESHGTGDGQSYSQGSGRSSTDSMAQSIFLQNGTGMGPINTQDMPATLTTGSGSNIASSEGSARSTSEFSATARSQALSQAQSQGSAKTESSGTATSTSESQGYSETLEPILEIMPTATYSLEEQAHVFAIGLMQQPTRHCVVKLPGKSPRAITTLDMSVPIVGQQKLSRVISQMKQASPFLVPREQAKQEIIERETFFDRSGPVAFTPTVETKFIEK